MNAWLNDKFLLLIYGMGCAAAAWAFFHYLQDYAFYGLALLVIVSYGITFIVKRKIKAK